jgi:acyl-CoA thioesterase FadM
MYPFFRMLYQVMNNIGANKLPIDGVHISHHRCWPVDIDPWGELNNGRTLTLYDFGRIQIFRRTGLVDTLRHNGWRLTMAGATVRYRRRVTVFDRFEMRTRILGRGQRFFYIKQSMWKQGEALSSVVYRVAVVGESGIVPSQEVADALGLPDWNPALPDWVQGWIDAENRRSWPPSA